MTRNRSRGRFWTILGIVNLLMLLYPMNMLLGADSQDGTVVAVIALCGVGLVLAVGDIISVMLAYSTSY
jgi:hypothetical protein